MPFVLRSLSVPCTEPRSSDVDVVDAPSVFPRPRRPSPDAPRVGPPGASSPADGRRRGATVFRVDGDFNFIRAVFTGEKNDDEDENEGAADGGDDVLEDRFFSLAGMEEFVAEDEALIAQGPSPQNSDSDEDSEEEDASDGEWAGSDDEEYGRTARYGDFFEKHEAKRIPKMDARHKEAVDALEANHVIEPDQRPWELRGEVKASDRPRNSLLGLDATWDGHKRDPPPLDADFGLKIEEVIKDRVLESNFDDVVPQDIVEQAYAERKQRHTEEDDDGAAEEGEGEEVKHEVARVVKERQRGGRLEYRVKWSMGDSTWEPLEHVEGLEALAEYRARKAAGGDEPRAGKAASAARRPAGDAPRGGAGSDDEEWHAEDDQYEDENEGEEEEEDELEEELEHEQLEELEEGELEEGELRQPRGAAAAGASHGDGGPSGDRGKRGGGKRRRQSTAEVSPYGESDDELEDKVLDDGLRMPGRLWKHLFTHQQTCIEWLWELHRQEAGGVVGDEMGLGKTLQVVGIWAALHHSGRGGPCIVVSPATVMRQWVRELRRWAPEIETQLLHNSTGASDPATRSKLVRGVVRAGEGGACAVLVTSYEAVRQQAGLLLQQQWQYVVLDEGHKIRNPDAAITQVCKRFNTGHRLILSGSPIQNKLTELWSLFDFVFPGKLGTLPTFQEQFGLPIAAGTYANASRFKVQAAYQCSLVLRSLIRPHLLRRLKADVDIELPDKTEQVRMCQLTPPEQREA